MRIKKQSWCVRTVWCWPPYQWLCENPPGFGPLEQIRLFVTWIWIKCWQCVFLLSTDTLLLCSLCFLQFSVPCCHNNTWLGWGEEKVLASCLYRHKHGWKLSQRLVKNIQRFRFYKCWNAVSNCGLSHGSWLASSKCRNVDTSRVKQTFWLKRCTTFCQKIINSSPRETYA